MIVKAIWEFDANVSDLDPNFVDVPELAKDLARRELDYLLFHNMLGTYDFEFANESSMTLKKLKTEADKHGYRLVKDNPTVKLLPCPVCGSKRTIEWIHSSDDEGIYSRECNKCDFRASREKTKRKARESWNKAVLEYQKGEPND